jgi:hypothetical protein
MEQRKQLLTLRPCRRRACGVEELQQADKKKKREKCALNLLTAHMHIRVKHVEEMERMSFLPPSSFLASRRGRQHAHTHTEKKKKSHEINHWRREREEKQGCFIDVGGLPNYLDSLDRHGAFSYASLRLFFVECRFGIS